MNGGDDITAAQLRERDLPDVVVERVVVDQTVLAAQTTAEEIEKAKQLAKEL